VCCSTSSWTIWGGGHRLGVGCQYPVCCCRSLPLTPSAAAQVDLCGHATLAAAHHLFEQSDPTGERETKIRFHTRSGELLVTRLADGQLEMNFPAAPAIACDLRVKQRMAAALGCSPVAVSAGIAHTASR
jgi:predicted PhzF superfamily epimerase YddE/YHI9